MYKKFLVASCLIVNTHFFINAASDPMRSTSYNLCTTTSSSSAAPVQPVVIKREKTHLYNLYPSARKVVVLNHNSGATATLSPHSSLMPQSEETDLHYKQHSSDTPAQADHENSTTHASASFTSTTSTIENPLELGG